MNKIQGGNAVGNMELRVGAEVGGLVRHKITEGTRRIRHQSLFQAKTLLTPH